MAASDASITAHTAAAQHPTAKSCGQNYWLIRWRSQRMGQTAALPG